MPSVAKLHVRVWATADQAKADQKAADPVVMVVPAVEVPADSVAVAVPVAEASAVRDNYIVEN